MNELTSRARVTALVALRFAIGWHFFYEGLAKAQNSYWTAAGYLGQSKGIFSGLFGDLAANPSALAVVDFLNVWGLILVGLALMLGFLTRTSTALAALMLVLYYVAAPPWPGLEYALPAEGSYLIVNKTFVELCAALVTLGFPTGHIIGLDRLVARARGRRREAGAPTAPAVPFTESER